MNKMYVLNEKKEFILSEVKCPKSVIFSNNYWAGESGKVISPVRL